MPFAPGFELISRAERLCRKISGFIVLPEVYADAAGNAAASSVVGLQV